MEAYYEILSQCPLFTGITRQEMPEILNCLDKKVVEIPKGDPVFLEGEPARFVGVVLSGGVADRPGRLLRKPKRADGGRAGGLFAEAFACAGWRHCRSAPLPCRTVPCSCWIAGG